MMTRKILCDVNVWLALALSGHHLHVEARSWLEGVDAPGAVIFCRATQQGLLRLLCNPAVLGAYGNPALTNRQAWNVYEAFLADDRIQMAAVEPAGLEARWKTLSTRDTASSKLWMDAYLAAFALTGGYRIVTGDAAYRQFSGLDLRVLAPLDDKATEAKT